MSRTRLTIQIGIIRIAGVLDTSPRISNFLPSAEKIQARKITLKVEGEKKVCFHLSTPSIIRISSQQSSHDPNILFSYGHPLWGSHLKHRNLDQMTDLAKAKERD